MRVVAFRQNRCHTSIRGIEEQQQLVIAIDESLSNKLRNIQDESGDLKSSVNRLEIELHQTKRIVESAAEKRNGKPYVIHPNLPSTEIVHLVSKARKVDISITWLTLLDEPEFQSSMLTSITKNNARWRVLLQNPDSLEAIKVRARELDVAEDHIKQKIFNSLVNLEEIRQQCGSRAKNIEIRASDHLCAATYTIDDTLFATPFYMGKQARYSPCTEYAPNDPHVRFEYNRDFNARWGKAKILEL